jgi:orotidine 5'-phosphate decarboxylase subfamily 2
MRVEELGAPLCLGVDPHPDALPPGLPRTARGIETFARGLIESTADLAAAIKVNVAFFEAFGSDGWAALERVRAAVPPHHFLVLDAKRGDIGPTAERYAESLLGRLDADAVTLSPYLGEDAIEPFLAVPDRVVYVLARTSNPSAGRLQDLPTSEDRRPLHEHVALWVSEQWTDGRVGLVVGATAPDELADLRRAAPGPAFLVPGIGAQDGDQAAAVRHCHGAWAPGLVSVSRAIAGAARSDQWRDEVRLAAERWLAMLRQAGATLIA